MLIAQFSDTHIQAEGQMTLGRVDTSACLRQALSRLNSLPQKPDVLLITGDLVEEGSIDEYEQLRRLLDETSVPWLLMVGNHDDRQALGQVFPDQPGAATPDRWRFAITRADWPLRIVALDTLWPGHAAGWLGDDQLQWLQERLQAEPSRPTLLALHHPPFQTGIAAMDAIGLEGREALRDVLAEHAQVQLVVSGHLHRSIRSSIAGRPAVTAPSTAHSVELDLGSRAPLMFRLDASGFLLHWWSGSEMVTHHVLSDPGAGPFAFG